MTEQAPTPEQQKRLRETGFLAAAGERWEHPEGMFHLQPMPAGATRHRFRDNRPQSEGKSK